MKLALGCDHGGYALMQEIKRLFVARGVSPQDFGAHSEESCDYPDYVNLRDSFSNIGS